MYNLRTPMIISHKRTKVNIKDLCKTEEEAPIRLTTANDDRSSKDGGGSHSRNPTKEPLQNGHTQKREDKSAKLLALMNNYGNKLRT